MNREDIIRMAREAFGAPYSSYLGKRSWDISDKQVERFAALVAAAERDRRAFEIAESYRCGWDGGVKAEREECAKVCEEKSMVKGGEVFAAKIRARGEK